MNFTGHAAMFSHVPLKHFRSGHDEDHEPKIVIGQVPDSLSILSSRVDHIWFRDEVESFSRIRGKLQ